MASPRGRDLTVSVLSDVDKFDLDKPADQLDALGRNASDAGRKLDDLERDLDDSGRALRDVGDDADRAARDLDDAFDKIKRSSKDSSRKIDTDTDDVKGSLREVGDEAADTGREMFASFSGSMDDITGAAQELAANAGGMFGPVGLALGGALAVGVSLFTKAKEDLKERVAEITDALIEGAGKIEEESIVAKLREFAQDGSLETIRRDAEAAGVSADLMARALAGDADAADVLNARIDEQIRKLQESTKTGGRAITQVNAQARALGNVSHQLGRSSTATDKARSAWEVYRDATASGIVASVRLDIPEPRELDRINRALRDGIGTIVVPLKPGQNRFANTADNSRYRE